MNKEREQLRQLDKEQLIDIILELRGMVVKLATRVEQLEGQLAKNSRNSSKPPSSDGLKKKPAPKSERERGKRESGGQAGYTGETLEAVEKPDEMVLHRLESCPHCAHDLSGVEVDAVSSR